MMYNLVPSTRFKKSLKKYLNKPSERSKIFELLEALKSDGFDGVPIKMKLHKLIGITKVAWNVIFYQIYF